MWVRYILLLFPPVLQSWLAILMWRRGTGKQLRFFFVYTIFAVVAELTKFALYQPGKNTWPHFWASWGGEAIYAVLGFLAIHEVFRHVFDNFNRLPWFKFLLPTVGVVMLSISVLIPILHPAVDTDPLLESIFSLQIAVRCLQLGVFFLIFFLARVFDLDYRQYAFGIAAGFGIAAAGILLGTLVRTGGGLKFLIYFRYVPSVTYCIAVIVWLASFVRAEPEDPFRDVRSLFAPELFLEQLQRYKQEVRGIFKP
jgi:uncharacterized membrane protein (DUF441 family)